MMDNFRMTAVAHLELHKCICNFTLMITLWSATLVHTKVTVNIGVARGEEPMPHQIFENVVILCF